MTHNTVGTIKRSRQLKRWLSVTGDLRQAVRKHREMKRLRRLRRRRAKYAEGRFA